MNDLDVSFARTVARRFVRDPQDAADVAQDALLLAYRHQASFRGTASYRTWLYRIVATTALGHLRRHRRRALLDAAAGDRDPGHTPSPEAKVAAAEIAAAARRAVAEMGDGYAEVLFFPGYLVILILRKIFGFSYDGFVFYLSLLLRDHLAPVIVALAGFLLLQKTLRITGTEESIFLTVFSFLCGFFSLVNVTDLLRDWGAWNAYVLFILPVLRIAAALGIALTAERFFRWEGRQAGQFLGVGAGISVILALSSFFYGTSRLGWAIAIAVAVVVGGVVMFAARFPRAVSG